LPCAVDGANEKEDKKRKVKELEKEIEGEKSEGGVDENGSQTANYHESNFPLRSQHKVMA
jgi:hypothetical protein